MPRRYRFGKGADRPNTYEEMLADLKKAIERELRLERKRKRKEKRDNEGS